MGRRRSVTDRRMRRVPQVRPCTHQVRPYNRTRERLCRAGPRAAAPKTRRSAPLQPHFHHFAGMTKR